MTDKEKIINDLKCTLNGLDCTSDLRLVLIRTIEYLQEESASEGWEEAAEKCIESLIPETELNSTTPFALEYVVELLHKAFKVGAKWMAEQGESLEGKVMDRGNYIYFPNNKYIDLDPAMRINHAFMLKEGDNVIVQIRKED